MSIEEAIRILHPDTTLEALAEIEYYNGFKGAEKVQEAVTCACLVACDELRKIVSGELISVNHKHDGKTSDGYHTFDELYHHRAVLFATVVADHPAIAWKSKLHHDGTMYDGMFIVGLKTPDGQATYHYDLDPYWDMFDCAVIERAPEWDGHTSAQALERICKIRLYDHKEYIDKEALIAHLTKQMLNYDGSKINLRKNLYWNAASVLEAIRSFAPVDLPVSSEVQDE